MRTPHRPATIAATAAPPYRHRDHPYTDTDSAAVLDEALASLGKLRYPMAWLGDDAITVHLLTSLQQQIQQRLPDAVADARDQENTWAEIADTLGTTAAAARNRYGRPGRRGQTRPVTD